ncbi:MAG: FAD-binding oxidoreductase [Anaerolineales bacterium]|nr:FAD-binding oxidoreductase [Anaerolineales bacterium]
MRRWNGWGETEIDYPVPDTASRYLESLIGVGEVVPDATLETALAQAPASRLPENPAYTTAALNRLHHARGQSLPDWIALRHGQIGAFPDGVAYPQTVPEVAELLRLAQQKHICLIPYGGGTSVLGHINPLAGERPVLTIDMRRMNHLLSLDKKNHLAKFEAGASGPEVEASLSAQGYTLGHFPQSFEYSTLGGWVATRSSGQQSHLYGRIEDLFLGGRLETFYGTMELPPFPDSAAGPDLRQLVLGGEGRIGILTQATVRVRPRPVFERYAAAFFPTWEHGLEALRRAAQERIPMGMLRLSDATETETTLILSGKKRLVGAARGLLNAAGYRTERCLLVYAIAGETRTAQQSLSRLKSLLVACRGLLVGQWIGKMWKKNQFRTPYMRNTLWELGYALDTIETATTWEQAPVLAARVQAAICATMEEQNQQALAFTHVSHIYETGANVYTTFIFPRAADPAATLERWQAIKRAASLVIVKEGGTISHQHGVGVDHAPYLSYEKSAVGMKMLAVLHECMDPDDLMNPGKLI